MADSVHSLQRDGCEPHERLVVDAKHLDGTVDGQVEEGTVLPCAGVVHQKVDHRLAFTDSCFHERNTFVGCEIGGDDFGPNTQSCDPGRDAVEPVDISGDQDEVDPEGRQLTGDGFTDAGRGAGDQRPFPLDGS